MDSCLIVIARLPSESVRTPRLAGERAAGEPQWSRARRVAFCGPRRRGASKPGDRRERGKTGEVRCVRKVLLPVARHHVDAIVGTADGGESSGVLVFVVAHSAAPALHRPIARWFLDVRKRLTAGPRLVLLRQNARPVPRVYYYSFILLLFKIYSTTHPPILCERFAQFYREHETSDRSASSLTTAFITSIHSLTIHSLRRMREEIRASQNYVPCLFRAIGHPELGQSLKVQGPFKNENSRLRGFLNF